MGMGATSTTLDMGSAFRGKVVDDVHDTLGRIHRSLVRRIAFSRYQKDGVSGDWNSRTNTTDSFLLQVHFGTVSQQHAASPQ